MKNPSAFIAAAITNAGPGQLPCHDAKAKFANGTKVELRDMWFGRVIFSGIVTGAGTDEYGEYQEVKITSPKNRKGRKRVRLMDLRMLQETK